MNAFRIKVLLFLALLPFSLLAKLQIIDLSDQKIPVEGATFYVEEVVLNDDLPANIGFVEKEYQGCFPTFLS